ncbi:hypothetical protein B0H14DRAFT_2626029 [Mycena olivaceomarginata]|nr:hypothetical protein B0H14DRAFT_2626029 [Mycena olivaceomarginata]
MNYDNYIKSLVVGKNVGLVNWLQGVDFKRMSLQSAIGPLRMLYDSLKCRTTRWKVLTTAEKKQLLENHNAMVAVGSVQEKVRRPRAKGAALKKGGCEEDSEEDEEEDEEEEVQAKPCKKQATRMHTSGSRPQGRTETKGEEEHGDNEGEDDECGDQDQDDEPHKPIVQMSVEEKRARLLKLARATEGRRGSREKERGAVKTKAVAKGKEKERARAKEKTKAMKRKRGGGDEEREKGRKKTKRDAGQAGGAKRRAPDEEEGSGGGEEEAKGRGATAGAGEAKA